MSRQRLPNRIQALVASIALVWLTVVLAPLSAIFTLLSLRGHDKPLLPRGPATRGAPTVLVNGARMQKSLFIARALARQGWRVVVIEERGWGLLSPARFSSFVSKFILVPSGGGQAYIDAIVNVATSEGAILFVPCSGAGTTHEDAVAADILRQRDPAFKAVIQDPDLVLALHEKDKFISLLQSYGLDAPHSVMVDSPEALLDLLRSPNQPPRILKCAAELDDLGRSDLTLYPFTDAEGEPDWPATERRIRGLGIPICSKTPYIAQEFVGGKGATEWCTHATVVDGQVRAFVCCPSNDMLMTYYAAKETHPVHRRALQWTHDFMTHVRKDPQWRGKSIDGHYSFDFIHKPDGDDSGEQAFEKGRLVAIECNPRVHTAVGLLSDSPDFGPIYGSPAKRGRADREPGKSYASAASEPVDVDDIRAPPAVVTTGAETQSMSWLGHDIPARLLPLVLPRSLRSWVHPLWLSATEAGESAAAGPASSVAMDLDSPGRREASWDAEDPWPFFVLYHFAWPYLLLRQILVRRRAWSRINVSTARIFEC
ncbi:unnamed protein product [Parajaminaea phylloscopi]